MMKVRQELSFIFFISLFFFNKNKYGDYFYDRKGKCISKTIINDKFLMKLKFMSPFKSKIRGLMMVVIMAMMMMI